MSNIRANTDAFIEAEQYSQFILENLHTVLLPGSFYRDVSDFGQGTTLNIKTIGIATVQEVEEDTPLIYNPIETGNVTLAITDYKGDAWYVTDVLRQDGAQIDQLLAARAMEATRAINQNFETRFLATCNDVQTDSGLSPSPQTINGFAHRFLATGGNETMAENDFIDMRLAFDKANVPMAGRIAIVDPVVAATFSKLITLTAAVEHDRSPIFQGLLENGFANEHQFVMNLHGWNIWTSNLLPDIASGTSVDNTVNAGFASKAAIFMSILDDNTKPIMAAWRQQPKVEGERNKDRQRDEFVSTCRYGLGAQRLDTLGVVVHNATATA
jgi:hypothetical protein